MLEDTNISVIIPVHELTEVTEKYFKNAIKSIEEQMVKPDKVLIVAKSNENLIKKLSDFNYGEISHLISIIENDGDTDTCSQINLGVQECQTEWFSFLEMDDEYSDRKSVV